MVSVFHNIINAVNPLPYFWNNLAKPYLEALDHMIDEEEEGEWEEEDDDDQEERQKDKKEQEEGQEEKYNNDENLYRKFIEDEFSDSDVE